MEEALRGLEVKVSDTTVLRDVVSCGEEAKRNHQLLRGKVRVERVGIDGTGVLLAGQGNKGVILAMGLDEERVLLVRVADEQDLAEVRGVIRELVRQRAVREVVTDEAGSYLQALEGEAPQVKHWLCGAHFRRNKVRRVKEIAKKAQEQGPEGLAQDARRLEELLRNRPPQGKREVYSLHRWYLGHDPPRREEEGSLGWKMRMLTLEVWEKVGALTNNTVERVIGLSFKIRAKLMRGFKREGNLVRFIHLGGGYMPTARQWP